VVRVVMTKYDGRLHWHATLQRLGEDEHGTWLGAPQGTLWQRGAEPPVSLPPHVLLVPRGLWWLAAFNAEPAPLITYVDVCTVPIWSGDEVTMIDLDLDVVRDRVGDTVRLLDEDEFAEHRALFGYPDTVVSRAVQTAQALMAQVGAAEPFTAAYLPWLARVGSGGPA
jgi:protein associated with RNAse G/E